MAMGWLRGDIDACRRLQFRLLPLIRALFSEVSPIPVKAALAMMGRIEDALRPPLVPLDDLRRDALRAELAHLGLIEGDEKSGA